MLTIEKVATEYLHLLKTKKGIDESVRNKKIQLAKECRGLVAKQKYDGAIPKVLADIVLEYLNGR
ncbi:MAG TPA: hypothetical protein VMX17_00005 [Candidatus Glassbacteria bacterium]|nr:hypothetical protein [Candidatus Glassbacteria bacterium]